MKKIDYLRELLIKKEKQNLNEFDRKKVENLKTILQNDNVFFYIDLDTAVGILDFLEIPRTEIKQTYFELVSAQNFIETDKPYILTDL